MDAPRPGGHAGFPFLLRMSIFLTGTDTGVGKTHTAAALLLRYPGLRYWKPVQTGPDDDRATARALSGLSADRFLSTGWSFRAPLAPHLAAELEGRADEVSVARIHERFNEYARTGPLLVEGAGGLLVPLRRVPRETWLAFIIEANLPVVIAARTALGTINHTLLTIQALRGAGARALGVVFCGADNPDNRRTIAQFGGVDDLGCFDAADRVETWSLDPRGVLAQWV